LAECLAGSEFVTLRAESLQDALRIQGVSAGYPDGFFAELVDEEMVRKVILAEAERLYDPEAQGADSAEFQELIEQSAIEYAKGLGADVTPDIASAIAYFAGQMEKTYESAVSFPLFDTLQQGIAAAKGLLPKAFGAGLLLLIIAAVVIAVIQRRKISTFRYLSYASGASALCLAALLIFVRASGLAERLALGEDALGIFVTDYASGLLLPVVIAVVGLVAAAVVLALLYEERRKTSGKYIYRAKGL
jgi:hypothetical protein